jgi:signal transduction histidine kinase
MLSSEGRSFGRLNQSPSLEREQQRLDALHELGLCNRGSVPVFEEATQTAARLLDATICILGVIDRDRQFLKSAIGLSKISLMNDLASSRQLPRQEAFCAHVVDSHQVLLINDTLNTMFSDSTLVQQYGIRAYLGVPLITFNGYCIGTLAVMELAPRSFYDRDIELLELVARWSMSEFERDRFLKSQTTSALKKLTSTLPAASLIPTALTLKTVKVDLISQITQELCTPLTSIMGMASMLSREIYGPLTNKQKEYMDIIQDSGQDLLTLVNEILEVGALGVDPMPNIAPTDVEMLCQQAFSTLGTLAQRRDQQIRLTIEPGRRIWSLDKDKVRQILYHLVFNLIQASSTASVIRVHIAHKRNQLQLTIWTSHPWLGEGLPQSELQANRRMRAIVDGVNHDYGDRSLLNHVDFDVDFDEQKLDLLDRDIISKNYPDLPITDDLQDLGSVSDGDRQSLGLMLSCCLAQAHNGEIAIQGFSESGYRYVISLPELVPTHNPC